jgi:hypothetical protein
MSALFALSEKPSRIEKLFLVKKLILSHQTGVYAIGLTKNGGEETIVVDDFIATLDLEPAFAKGKFWVVILEKAWAKLH